MSWKIRKDGKFDTGRPTKIDEEVLKKLHQAFSIGCSDEEACSYANISPQTLYNYQKVNKEFVEYKEQLKKNPILKAKYTVVKSIEKDPKLALDYLKCKLKDEFNTRTEITGANGEALSMPSIINVVPVRAKEEDGK